MSALFDPGLQPERTELAWRRTALALAIGSLIALRLLPAFLGSGWWSLGGVAGLLLAAAIWWASERRFARVRRVLLAPTAGVLPGAGLLLLLTLVTVVVGGISLAVVLVGALR